ncbi:Methyltransferase type 11 [Calothrix sp. PCC 7716]|nr:Methyltransferase type 11 [Calothrix sp. PCC 7716]
MSVMSFKDYFSKHAREYVRYRPLYPEELFKYLSGLVQSHELAWDCGTGNGQVAQGLVKYFSSVYASDASSEQIANALKNKRIKYFVTRAESTSLPSSSIDLITVGQAFHWFDFNRFYNEANRVLKAEGVLAIWCYGFFNILDASEELQDSFLVFYDRIKSFWPPERQLVDDRYLTVPFPLVEIETPIFSMTAEWEVNELIGYLRTWSATQRCIASEGEEYILRLFGRISELWEISENSRRTVQWPIYLRVGRKHS